MISSLSLDVLVQVLDTLPVRVFWKDRASLLQGANQRFLADVGAAGPDDVIGAREDVFFAPAHGAAIKTQDAEILSAETPVLRQRQMLTFRNGAQIEVECNRLPLRDNAGALVGILVVYHDIGAK